MSQTASQSLGHDKIGALGHVRALLSGDAEKESWSDDDDWVDTHGQGLGWAGPSYTHPVTPDQAKPPFSYSVLEDMRARRRRKQSQEKAQEKNIWRGESRRKNVMATQPISYFHESGEEETGQNGWQLRRENLRDRVSILFNSKMMSDVLFRIDGKIIPAHKFLLAAASPVFYTRFYETMTQARSISLAQSFRSRKSTFLDPFQGSQIIEISDHVSAGAFFEFIRFIYTDEVNVTLENAQDLCVLADDYKVAGLQEKVMDYVASVSTEPDKAFICLGVLKRIYCKQILYFWRDLTESHLYPEEGFSRASTRPSSGYDRKSVTPDMTGRRCTSAGSVRSSNASSNSFSNRTQEKGDNFSKRNRQLSYKLALVIKDMNTTCWHAIEKEAEQALVSKAFLQTDQQIIQELLQRRRCSVPEVALFRAIVRWTDAQCAQRGLEPIGVNRRAVLGEKALRCLRFPAMTMEQIQWEVVPTGLLPHEDVHPLLHYKDAPAASLLRFSVNRRDGHEDMDLPVNRERPSLHPLRPTTPLLDPENDEIDQLLSSALFRNELRRQSEGAEGNRLFNSVLLTRRRSPGGEYERRPPRRAEDFERIAPGLYRYQGTSILRLCIEGGEVMVYELGTVYPGEPVDVAYFSYVREKGKGTPLPGFL